MIIVDSNIWAYYFDDETPEHRFVIEPLEKALRSEKVIINTTIIIEVAHFLIKTLGPIEGMERLNIFLRFPFTVVDLDYELTLRSIELLAKYFQFGIGGRDATILATAEFLKINRIMTHDKAFKRIRWIEVIDPIP